MILTCPACATSYFVPDTAIGPNGRRVRCKSCGKDWHVAPEEAPLDLAEVAAAVSSPHGDAIDHATAEDDTPPPLPQAFRAREQEKRRARRAVRQGLTWALLVVMVTGILSFLYLARDAIVTRAPSLASTYKMVGINTNAVGLEFEALNARFAAHDTSRVVVSGAIRNVRDREIVVPPLRISVRDINGREIGHEILRLDAPPVLPGGVQGFAAILPNPDGKFATAATTFVIEDKKSIQPAAQRQGQGQGQGQGQPAPSTAQALGANSNTAPSEGLRRVGDITPQTPALDTGAQDALSAKNG